MRRLPSAHVISKDPMLTAYILHDLTSCTVYFASCSHQYAVSNICNFFQICLNACRSHFMKTTIPFILLCSNRIRRCSFLIVLQEVKMGTTSWYTSTMYVKVTGSSSYSCCTMTKRPFVGSQWGLRLITICGSGRYGSISTAVLTFWRCLYYVVQISRRKAL